MVDPEQSEMTGLAKPIGEDQNPDDGAEELLQEWRLQEDQRDYEEADESDHRF
jgi:hypothetical protein